MYCKRKKVYVCSCYGEKIMKDLWLNELVDHFDIVDLKITSNVNIASHSKISKAIVDSDIILAFIELKNYTYPETLVELGMAAVLKKPTVIFNSLEEDETSIISTLPIYWAESIIHTKKWRETENAAQKISKLIDDLEKISDSDD